MFTEYFIFTTLLFAQIIIGVFAWRHRMKLPRRYSHYLSEMITPAVALENYSKIYRSIGLKVNAHIHDPAYALTDFVLISKRHMYVPDLFTNYFTIFQLELSKKEHEHLRALNSYQNILFTLQNVLLVVSLVLTDIPARIAILAAISIQVILIILSFLGYLTFNFILDEVHEIAKDLLNLDEVETARAESLKSELSYRVFEYPFETLWRLYQFFKP